ncbi:MAG: HD domain-containing protein [Candidatus Thermoplasmatota archaeon]
MVNKEEIENIFEKELQLIKDKKLREKVVKVWKNAADEGGWNSLEEIPFTLLFENSGLLADHTKRVAKLVKTVLDKREEKLNQDFLIAGVLLHDVGKLLEYDVKNGEVVKGDYGKKFRHPVSGSKLAWQIGLPDEVVHIIYAHSHEGDKTNRSSEAVIVHHCDFIDFHIKKGLIEK